MQTVVEMLVQHLKKWGVTHVFGIPGKPITPLILELDRQGIVYVLSKHEGGAGFEAAGYAQANKTLGVALGTAGPGGTNMLTAAGQAQATNLPVLFLTGQPPVKDTGKSLGQDSTMFGNDLVKMFESVTKFSARVEHGHLLEIYLKHALEQAFAGVPGPIHLSIPIDVFAEAIEPFDLELPVHHPKVISSNLDEVIEIISSASRPALFVGVGVHSFEVYEELESFAEQWRIPVMTTPGAKGAFRSNHPLALGPFGLGGYGIAEQYMSQFVDVLIVMGSHLSDMELSGLTRSLYPGKIVHFEHEAKFIGKTIPVPTVPVLGNLKYNLQQILQRTQGQPVDRSFTRILPDKEPPQFSEYLTGQQVMKVLRSALPSDTVVFGDSGSHSFYAIKYFDIEEPGTFFFEEIFGSMGQAIGYSIGAKIARPDKTIVCLTGDGCMFMSGMEISTAVNYDAPVIFIVMNNGSLDMVNKGMAAHLGRAVGTVYETPLNAALFGESIGALSFRCKNEEELQQAVAHALESKQATVIDVIVDPFEIPPTMKRG
jgi:acetolactate synthase-1/2/3 large subunit